jgi:hypothetical protein
MLLFLPASDKVCVTHAYSKLAQLFLKNEGPNRIQPQSLTRPQVKCLVLSHYLGAIVVFPYLTFLLLWALLFLLFLPLPPQTKGPILETILMLCALLHERFQLCPAISRRGVMLLPGTVGSSLCYTSLAWLQPMSSIQSRLLHRPGAFSYRRFELPVKNHAALSWIQTVLHRVNLVHCQPVGFGRTSAAAL